MSISTAIDWLRRASSTNNLAERHGMLTAAKQHVVEALKDTADGLAEQAPGQEPLPLDAPAAPGPSHTVTADGLVSTPADVDDGDALAGRIPARHVDPDPLAPDDTFVDERVPAEA